MAKFLFYLLLFMSQVCFGHHRIFNDFKSWSSSYSVKKNHHPQSTGKVYRNREIAEIMGAGGIPWLERQQRSSEEDLNGLVNALGLQDGMTIADFGAGSGVISILMAAKVGPKGRVLALDIQKEMLLALKKKLKAKSIQNVVPRLNSEKSLGVKTSSLDLVLMVDVYHELSYPEEILSSIFNSLKPGGRVALVEYRGEDPKVPIKILHKMTLAQIKKEFLGTQPGFIFGSLFDKLPQQHLVVFKKPMH